MHDQHNHSFSAPQQPRPSNQSSSPYTAPGPRKRSALKRLAILVALLVVCGAGMGGYFIATAKDTKQSTGSGGSALTLLYNDGTPLDDAPGFAAYVESWLEDSYGSAALSRGQWKVTTTLDPALQKTGREQLQTAQESLIRRIGAQRAALIAQDVQTGQIVSWVGGWSETAATTSQSLTAQKIQWDNLMLPITYAAYFNAGKGTPDTIVDDSRGPLPGYPCTDVALPGGNCPFNYDYRYRGPITVREALGGMRQVPAQRVALETETSPSQYSILAVPAMAERLGGEAMCYADESLKEETACYLAAAIGDGLFGTPQGIVGAYATLAHGGLALQQTPVLRIVQDGQTKYEWKQSAGERTLSTEAANNITSILTDKNANYLKARSEFFTLSDGTSVAPVASIGADAMRAAALQYTTDYVTAIWAVSDGQPLKGMTETATLPVTRAWLEAAANQ
jgi:membrane peptidoglycan carboxypeptidase